MTAGAQGSYIGRTLGGRYTVNARLGAGGWGEVYAAMQTDLGRPVAIKVLHTSVALSSEGIMRFEREAKAAAALGHPNIAQVTDFQANPGEPPFLVMELLTGRTLGAALAELPGRRMAPARMAWVAHQMLAGLDVAHRAGIVHRDIKPDNVFLVSMPGVEDHVKLLDFGIAKLASDTNASLTAQGTLLGSPAFMAPEQITSAPLDHRVDLYAVGATMYLALSGRMPFDATSMHALMYAITTERLASLNELDPSMEPGLSNLVARAMHRDRDGRFPTAEAMRQALEPWVAGVPRVSSNSPRIVSPMSIPTYAPDTRQNTPNYAASSQQLAPTPPAQMPPPMPMPMPPPMMQPMHMPLPVAPTPKGNGAIIGLLVAVVVLLLVAIGGAAAYFLFASRADAPAPVAAVSVSAPVASAVTPTMTTAPTASPVVPAGPGIAPPKGKPNAPTITDAGVTPPAPAPTPTPAPAGGKEFAGTKFFIGSGTFSNYEVEPSKAAIMRLGGAISGCLAATQFDPPDHQFTNWTLTVDPAGNVTNAHRTTSFEPHPKFDGCMIPVLRQMKFAAKPGGGTIQVGFTARTKDNP